MKRYQKICYEKKKHFLAKQATTTCQGQKLIGLLGKKNTTDLPTVMFLFYFIIIT